MRRWRKIASLPLRADDGRHPWIADFEQSPKAAFGELLAGYARIHPYERADAPDAARMLFGPLVADDPARQALGGAIIEWLEERRRQPLPAEPYRLQRFVREVCEAFEITAFLSVADAAVELRRGFVRWNEWVKRLVLSPSRDACAEYWRILALTQPLVAEKSSIQPHGLASFWLQVCMESGGRLPERYLTIGLLGLRRLPGAPLDGTEAPWLAALAHWALARRPSDEAFLAEWLPLKQLYPATPAQWRKRIATVLAPQPFKDAGFAPPAWWHADPDFQTMGSEAGSRRSARSEASLSPVPMKDWKPVVEAIERGEVLSKLGPQVDQIVRWQRHYAEGTGDPYFLVRMFTNFGMKLIQYGTDARGERARLAQRLAEEALQWEPRNVFAWSLWRDALVEQRAFEAAELVGWEFVRRVPDDPQPRTQLAGFLAKQPNRRNVAEALYHETIQRFPDDPYARNHLAELLIADERVPDAEAVVAEAFAVGALEALTYAIQARLRLDAGDEEGARQAVAEGLSVESGNAVLRRFESLLNEGGTLSLVSRAFHGAPERAAGTASTIDPSSDPFLAAALAQGRARRLRFQLESADDERCAKARAEVKRWLKEDPTFAYAELLAARQRIWAAESATLPPVAVAFENALAAEDRERLETLAQRMPRLEALVFVARAVLGDAEAAEWVEQWLRSTPETAEEPAVAALRTLMRPVLRVIEGGKSAAQAVAQTRTSVHALHDANEATLGDPFLAAA